MTFLEIQNRFLALVDESTISSTHKSHINYSIKDILNAFPFSWDIATSDLTVASGVANLPSDYNPKWRIYDARIVNSSTGDDYVYTEIDIKDRDKYSSTDYIYWITYSSGNYVFNTHSDGTVTIYYYTLPTDLSADSDVCIVPDGECVAMLAAAKHFLGEDQDKDLKELYEKDADRRIKALYSQDLNFGPYNLEYSKADSLADRGI